MRLALVFTLSFAACSGDHRGSPPGTVAVSWKADPATDFPITKPTITLNGSAARDVDIAVDAATIRLRVHSDLATIAGPTSTCDGPISVTALVTDSGGYAFSAPGGCAYLSCVDGRLLTRCGVGKASFVVCSDGRAVQPEVGRDVKTACQ